MSSPDLFTKRVLLSNCRIGNFNNKQFVALKFYEVYDLKKHKRLNEHNKH